MKCSINKTGIFSGKKESRKDKFIRELKRIKSNTNKIGKKQKNKIMKNNI